MAVAVVVAGGSSRGSGQRWLERLWRREPGSWQLPAGGRELSSPDWSQPLPECKTGKPLNFECVATTAMGTQPFPN